MRRGGAAAPLLPETQPIRAQRIDDVEHDIGCLPIGGARRTRGRSAHVHPRIREDDTSTAGRPELETHAASAPACERDLPKAPVGSVALAAGDAHPRSLLGVAGDFGDRDLPPGRALRRAVPAE